MLIETVPISRGLDWITEGFSLFRRNMLIWIVMFIIFLAIFLVLSVIPVIGTIATLLLQPVLLAGMYAGCKALDQGEELRIDHLFEGFRNNTSPLVKVGLISFAGYLLVFIIVAFIVGAAIGLGNLDDFDPDTVLEAGGPMTGFILSGLVGLALTIPIAMATWFAPALVMFDNLPAWDAMKASFWACLSNILPFLLYGIIAFFLTIVAMLPFGLGMLVLAPTLIASVYTGYRDIFRAA